MDRRPWRERPPGAAPYYTTYRTADGRFLAVGAIEEVFYTTFVAGLGLDPSDIPDRRDRKNWSALREMFGRILATRPRGHWEDVFSDVDACVTPVLSLHEATVHAQTRAVLDGNSPAEAVPLTDGTVKRSDAPPAPGKHTASILRDRAGCTRSAIGEMLRSSTAYQSPG
ncbi:CoA transferase [Blastococcus brunescens]|uniref:CoA transferase n=1 Tax=Blastococcus brunescens TaxID=1564165 RepID=A0ABZ1B7N9_9ACTN|nr:CoA transferase [Blastococcus sp. BMG 8361]WRL65404.1 CoA transferase [Blastococcus sp. BMG 8361]